MAVHDRGRDRLNPHEGASRDSFKSQSRDSDKKEKQGKMENRPRVLARLPDLDMAELDRVIDADPPVNGRRPLMQRLSTAVLVSAGVLFVVVALQPHLRKGGGGMQPPAPSAPAAPAWDAMAAKKASPTAPVQQAETLPPVPVSIPALPTSIPAVPDSIQGPAVPSSNPSGMPVPSFNTQSQAQPGDAVPGMAEASSEPAGVLVTDGRITSIAPPPRVNPSAPAAAPVAAVYQASAVQPSIGTPVQAQPNQAMALQPGVTPAYPNYPQTADASANPAAAFAGAANTAASLGAHEFSAEPGVARLQGVIEKSTQRPTYDSARSSLR
jgi:hypothetical protein